MDRARKSQRVVFLLENMSFPKDPRVRGEAIALKRQGWEVSVISPMGASRNHRWFETVEGVRVYRYWQPFAGGNLWEYCLEFAWAMTWTLGILAWIFMRDGFDVLHGGNPPDLFWIIALPFVLMGKKFVFDQHDLCPELLEARRMHSRIIRKLCLLMERRSYDLAEAVIVTNQSAFEIAAERGAGTRPCCPQRPRS